MRRGVRGDSERFLNRPRFMRRDIFLMSSSSMLKLSLANFDIRAPYYAMKRKYYDLDLGIRTILATIGLIFTFCEGRRSDSVEDDRAASSELLQMPALRSLTTL